MSLAEEMHAAHRARLLRMGKPLPAKPVVELDQLQIVEAKLSTAQATIAELEELVIRQRKIIQSFADAGRAPMVADVISVVAEHFDLTKHNLVGTGRSMAYVHPRHIGYFLCQQFGYSLHQIGRGFNRDHTTALYGARKIALQAQICPEFAALLQSLEGKAIDYACKRFNQALGWSQ